MIGRLSTCNCVIDTEKEIFLNRCELHKDSTIQDVIDEHKDIRKEQEKKK